MDLDLATLVAKDVAFELSCVLWLRASALKVLHFSLAGLYSAA